MKSILIILFSIFLVLIFSVRSKKIHIDYKSFFRRGFLMTDDLFRRGVLYWWPTEQVKLIGAIRFSIEQKIERDFLIVTNIKSFAEADNLFKDTVYFKDMKDIVEFCKNYTGDKQILILFDEIFTYLEDNKSISRWLRSFLSQLRKRRILFVTTAQYWREIPLTFRKYVRFQVSCRKYNFLNRSFTFNSINNAEEMYWDEQAQDFVAPRISANFAKALLAIADSYNTRETIDDTFSSH